MKKLILKRKIINNIKSKNYYKLTQNIIELVNINDGNSENINIFNLIQKAGENASFSKEHIEYLLENEYPIEENIYFLITEIYFLTSYNIFEKFIPTLKNEKLAKKALNHISEYIYFLKYIKLVESNKLLSYDNLMINTSFNYDKDTDLKLIKMYFNFKTELMIITSNINKNLWVWNMIKNYSDDKLIKYLLTDEDILDLIYNSKNMVYYNPYMLNLVSEETQFKFLDKYINLHCSDYNNILDKVEKIDVNDIKWFNYIMDVLNYQTSKVLVKVLEKTNLSTEKKQEILLMRNGKSCKL